MVSLSLLGRLFIPVAVVFFMLVAVIGYFRFGARGNGAESTDELAQQVLELLKKGTAEGAREPLVPPKLSNAWNCFRGSYPGEGIDVKLNVDPGIRDCRGTRAFSSVKLIKQETAERPVPQDCKTGVGYAEMKLDLEVDGAPLTVNVHGVFGPVDGVKRYAMRSLDCGYAQGTVR